MSTVQENIALATEAPNGSTLEVRKAATAELYELHTRTQRELKARNIPVEKQTDVDDFEVTGYTSIEEEFYETDDAQGNIPEPDAVDTSDDPEDPEPVVVHLSHPNRRAKIVAARKPHFKTWGDAWRHGLRQSWGNKKAEAFADRLFPQPREARAVVADCDPFAEAM